jgi:glutamate--cysteine ligase
VFLRPLRPSGARLYRAAWRTVNGALRPCRVGAPVLCPASPPGCARLRNDEVSLGQDNANAELRGIDDLLLPFAEACKPAERFRVGTEAEKIGILVPEQAALPFEGERSVRRILTRLVERYGWAEEREHEHAPVIALRRDAASITLEPAGQLELSGAPLSNIHQTAAEFATHVEELQAIGRELGIAWISLGFHPFARQEDLPRVPKARYAIMERYLPTRGPRSLDMMRRTCTVQANLDYSSEADAVRKLRVSLALQPVVTAMFANSPFYEGKQSELLSERAAVWLGMDPDRSGLLPFAWQRDFGFREYVEWALDVPMFLIKRGSEVYESTSRTFREYLRDGAEGTRATRYDWELHINTLFPEARLKHTLEMRGADAQPASRTCALPALWKGLLYDERALAGAEALAAPLEPALVQAARADIARLGLSATLAGKPLSRWAGDVLDLARGGLARHAVKDARGRDETMYLDPIARLVEAGRTPAQLLLAAVEGAPDFRSAVIEAAAF